MALAADEHVNDGEPTLLRLRQAQRAEDRHGHASSCSRQRRGGDARSGSKIFVPGGSEDGPEFKRAHLGAPER